MSEVKKLIFKMKNESDYENRLALEEYTVNMFEAKETEIEQLKKRISWLESGSIHTCHAECEKPLCVANREIERLRAELADKDAIKKENGVLWIENDKLIEELYDKGEG